MTGKKLLAQTHRDRWKIQHLGSRRHLGERNTICWVWTFQHHRLGRINPHEAKENSHTVLTRTIKYYISIDCNVYTYRTQFRDSSDYGWRSSKTPKSFRSLHGLKMSVNVIHWISTVPTTTHWSHAGAFAQAMLLERSHKGHVLDILPRHVSSVWSLLNHTTCIEVAYTVFVV